MTAPSFKFPKVLDNTTLSTVAKCPRQAYFRAFLHIQKGTGVSIHLHAGKAYAAALETFRKSFYSPNSPTYHDLIDSLIPATRTLFLSYGYDEERESDPYWAASPKSCSRMLQTMIASLIEFPPLNDTVKPYMIDGEPAIEKSFTFEFEFLHPDTGDPILNHGRFDMLAETAGQIFVFDDKTTSSLGPSWRQQWDMRSQFTGYIKGAQMYDLPISGAIVRGHCILKGDMKFEQAISYRKPHQVEEWWHDAHALAHTLLQYYERAKDIDKGGLSAREAFPMLGTFNDSCSSYGGCQFKELCESKHPERWLANYSINEWDPMDPDAIREEVSATNIIARG